jgi:transcriptional regulator with XRE-family HTH domain
MATDRPELGRQHELAAFLRSRRARLLPEQVGLPRGTRRHTPGLRRGEVAMLAGITPEWYTRLEQGQDIRVSVQLLESLARVLQLDSDERAHLFLLALRQPPPVEAAHAAVLNPTLQLFLDQLGTAPTCIIDARLNVVALNAAYIAAFNSYMGEDSNYTTITERDRNIIWRIFTSPAQKPDDPEWDALARMYLAYFRASYGRFADDPWWAEQIAELNKVSPEFRRLWAQHNVLSTDVKMHKLMHHPIVGELHFELLVLQTVEPGDLRLFIFTPKNAETTAKVEQLLTLNEGLRTISAYMLQDQG